MKEERDALQRDVSPRLRTLCEQYGARFQAIDLRWGVRDEAALDQQTMEICLRDNTLRVWDLATGLLIATFHCDASALCCACAAPNLIVAGDASGRVYFLALEE